LAQLCHALHLRARRLLLPSPPISCACAVAVLLPAYNSQDVMGTSCDTNGGRKPDLGSDGGAGGDVVANS